MARAFRDLRAGGRLAFVYGAPGTSSLTHLEHNTAAAGIALDDADMAALDRVRRPRSRDAAAR